MGAILSAILGFLGTSIAKIFGDKVLGWIALKTILVALFTIVIPILLNNFIYDVLEIIFNFAGAQTADVSGFNGAMNFTGFLAWLIEQFQLPQVLSVLVSALLLRLCLSMIPFVRL